MSNIILLEHTNFQVGQTFQESLIYGGVGGIFNEMTLNESTDPRDGSKLTKFRGKFQEADAINKNKRTYPFDILESNVKRLMPVAEVGGLTGELDHPSDSIVHFKDASHKITKLWWDGKTLMGEGVILTTPAGKILKSLIENGVRIGISSRGVGNGKVNEDGILVIGESYKLITFDAVADPSTYEAYQEKVVSPKKESVNYQEISPKNEARNINNLPNKELILACVSGMFKKQVNQVKSRLN